MYLPLLQTRAPGPRQPVIQPLESRRLMSVAAPVDPAFAAMLDPAPFHPAYGVPFGPGFDPRLVIADGADHPMPVDSDVSTTLATTAVVTSPTTASNVIPDTAASLAQSTTATVAQPTVPLVKDLLDGPDGSAAAVTTDRAVVPVAEWARPAVFDTGGLALAPMAAGSAPAVSTADGDVVPVDPVATIDETPFVTDGTVVTPAPQAMVAMGEVDVAAPVPVAAAVPMADVSFGAPESATAAPSFGETVIESARGSHPLAIAVAAGAATALWVSTESARDRRREALCRTVAEAATDRRLIALGVFRG